MVRNGGNKMLELCNLLVIKTYSLNVENEHAISYTNC